VLGMVPGTSVTEPIWAAQIAPARPRGIKLVISDGHERAPGGVLGRRRDKYYRSDSYVSNLF
jgi:hypothetical protein